MMSLLLSIGGLDLPTQSFAGGFAARLSGWAGQARPWRVVIAGVAR